MKAALYEGKHSIKLTTQPIPECGPNDVLIKNLRAGICGSDVTVYEHGLASGHKIKLYHPFGHEMISAVAAVGKNVTDFKVGQRVYPTLCWPVVILATPAVWEAFPNICWCQTHV
jgi:threonine dehydrogenase-like Zn-dependent dehydrogenase